MQRSIGKFFFQFCRMYLEAQISNEPMLPYTMKVVWTLTFFGILQKKVMSKQHKGE